jgi:hypothetical protein
VKLRTLVSFDKATNRLRVSIEQFSATFILSLLLAALTIFELELKNHKSLEYALTRMIFSTFVAFPLQVAVEWLLAQPRQAFSRLWRWAPVAVGALYYPLTGYLNADLIRFALVFSSAILIAILIISGWTRPAAEFSRRLASILTAFLIAGLAGGVMNAGIFSIYLAVTELFGMKLSDKVFLYTPILLHTTFTLGIFLSFLPHEDKTSDSSPPWLDFLLRVVLIPVLSIYGAVLALYFGKILLFLTLPKGTVATNITTYALAGLASCLLAIGYSRPLYARFFRWFQISLLVFSPMLIVGVARRLQEYGMTEERLLLLILACALIGIGVSLGVLGKNRPQWIGGIFVVLVLTAVLCPVNIFTLSFASQKKRFEAMLSKHQLVTDGKFIREQKEMMGAELEELRSLLRYLVKTHGIAFLQPLIHSDWNFSLDEPWNERNLSDKMINQIAILKPESYKKSDGSRLYQRRSVVFYGPYRFPSQEIFPCQFLLGISGLERYSVFDGLTLEISGDEVAVKDRQKRKLLQVLPDSLAKHAEESWKKNSKAIQEGASKSPSESRPPSEYVAFKGDSVKLALGLQALGLSAEGVITRMEGHAYVQVSEPLCR